jgi:hypothetical protein
MPTPVVVTKEDVDDIARKLDEFGAVLNDREKIVLLGILALAGHSVDDLAQKSAPVRPSGNPPPSTAPSLSSGFREAFQKGVGTRFTLDPTDPSQTERIKSTKVGVDIDF